MNSIGDAVRRLEDAKARVEQRPQSSDFYGLGTELFAPDEKAVRGKQMTVPASIRRRWTPTGDDRVLSLIGVSLAHGALLVLPKARATAWLNAPGAKPETFELSMQKSGNFEIPVAVRQRWNGARVVRIDFGFCYGLVPKDNVAKMLDMIRGTKA